MSARPSKKKTQSKGSQAIVIFWLVFIIAIIFIFMINAETIQRNFNYFKERLTSPPDTEELPLIADETAESAVDQPVPRLEPAIQRPTPTETVQTPSRPAQEAQPQTTQTPAAPQQTTQQPSQPQVTQRPQTTPTPTTPPPPATQTQTTTPVQTRDRNIYFAQIDRDGQILHSRVARRVPVSETPMIDTLNVLLTGPTAEELNRGLLNLVPPNTRILSATVRGDTAYISFSEDFLFNTFGVQGYVAQLRQIVWTVTEFPNVDKVQVLIEGRRLDYLGEGIWIGSPISRQSF